MAAREAAGLLVSYPLLGNSEKLGRIAALRFTPPVAGDIFDAAKRPSPHVSAFPQQRYGISVKSSAVAAWSTPLDEASLNVA